MLREDCSLKMEQELLILQLSRHKRISRAQASVAQLVGVSSPTLKVWGFNSQSRYITRLWVRSLVGTSMRSNQSMFLSHIDFSLSLPFPLKLIKIYIYIYITFKHSWVFFLHYLIVVQFKKEPVGFFVCLCDQNQIFHMGGIRCDKELITLISVIRSSPSLSYHHHTGFRGCCIPFTSSARVQSHNS